MSMILKGIDIPQKLYTDIRIYKDGGIKKIIGENTMISYNENVQAIQIPKGHGDIKDVGKIDIPSTNVDIFENCRNCNLLDDEQVKEIITNAPTILEAET